jgi:hypothetical protein
MGKVILDMSMSLDGFISDIELDGTRVIESPIVTHLRFRVVK